MMKFCLCLILATAPLFGQAASSATINPTPSREFGQPSLLPSGLNSIAPNLVEGRELNFPVAVAFDTSSSPPILYIADTFNNRVLAYQNPAAISSCGLNNPTCGFANQVVGQSSLTGTLPGGPGEPSQISYGFAEPTGVAVDGSGNLYVADTENNRILRFPAPFKQTSAQIIPDLIIGQVDLNHNQSNQGQNVPSNQTLSLAASPLRPVGLVIDSSGNLWVTDGGNNRVLRFPSTQLVAGTQPAADTVVGQSNFTSNGVPSPPSGTPAQLLTTGLNQPLGLAFDSNGDLYVADGYSRVVYYTAPLATGISAVRVLGVLVQNPNNPFPNVNQYALNTPFGLAVVNSHLYVADSDNNRIVEYDTPANWPAAASLQTIQPGQQVSPPIIAVIGQGNMNSGTANEGHAQAAAYTVSSPIGMAFLGTDMWVADAGNNRVIDFTEQSGGGYVNATRLVGQLDYIYSAANLIEGREMFFAGSVSAGAVAIDHSSSPPHMYIADTYNNRILCFNDARNVQASSRADMVLGQSTPTDFYDNEVNSGTNNASTPTQTGLYQPIGVVVDTNGDLFVADSGNGRVVRYPAPFAQPANSQQLPNLVLGQGSFSGLTITTATAQNMHTPWGIALSSQRSLVVSDVSDNRVLVFTRPSGGDFQNGQAAAVVLGQTSFTSTVKSTTTGGMFGPTGVTIDSSDRIYLCDTGNNRILFFGTSVSQLSNGQTSSFQLNGLNSPQAIVVTQDTGEFWIANTGNNEIFRFPILDDVQLNATPNNFQSVITAEIVTQTGPLGVALDDLDNLLVAEAANRITFFFAELTFASEASYNNVQVAPGELIGISQLGKNFSFTQDYNLSGLSPWPTTESINDLEIMVSAPGMTPTLAPMFRVDPTFISFQVPSNTPPSGIAVFQVIHPSTGAIIGEGDFQMAPYQPGFFTANASGSGQVAAFNVGAEYTNCTPQPTCAINSSGNAIPADGKHTIAFCLTGGGVFQGSPPDGVVPTGTANTAVQPQLISVDGFGATQGLVPPADVTYSGAGCGFPGGWQVNFSIPANSYAPGSTHIIGISLGGVASTVGYNGQSIQVWFATK